MVKLQEDILAREEAGLEGGLVIFTVELSSASLLELLAFLEKLKAKLKEVGASATHASFGMKATVEAKDPKAFKELKAWARELANPLSEGLGVGVYRR